MGQAVPSAARQSFPCVSGCESSFEMKTVCRPTCTQHLGSFMSDSNKSHKHSADKKSCAKESVLCTFGP